MTEPYRQRLLATYYKHGHSYYQQYSKDANGHFEGMEPWQIALLSAVTMLLLVQLWRVQHKRWAPIRTVGRDVIIPFTCSWHVSCYKFSQPNLHGKGIIWRSVIKRNQPLLLSTLSRNCNLSSLDVGKYWILSSWIWPALPEMLDVYFAEIFMIAPNDIGQYSFSFSLLCLSCKSNYLQARFLL